MRKLFIVMALLLTLGPFAWSKNTEPIKIASKHFTESYILAEIMGVLLESRGHEVKFVHGLGGTTICFEALRNRKIDLYPEYTGTLEKEILKSEGPLREKLREKYDLEILGSFGFNNTYAIAVLQGRDLRAISDLKKMPDLKGGLSYEFLNRVDGWPALKARYGLAQEVLGLEHGLAYEALASGKIDFTDVYTTDAKIEKLNLMILEDDLGFFPRYDAVVLARRGLPPEVISILRELEGVLDERTMIHLNAQAEIEKIPFKIIARVFLEEKGLIAGRGDRRSPFTGRAPLAPTLAAKTVEHLWITAIALVFAILIAVPLGILSERIRWLGRWIVPVTGLLQTIPSIALLAFMIPLFGIGKLPAIVALFIYGLLPIVRNTYEGIKNVEAGYVEIAEAMGIRPRQRLYLIELPLAYPIILAGVKTAAVINIGTATLAAFIGAGGLGEFIVTGLALNDHRLILQGAIPAAGLAILTEFAFRLFEPKTR